MKLIQNGIDSFITEDDLVEVYRVGDGSWRVSHYPFSDKDRKLTLEQAFALAEQRHAEAVAIKDAGNRG